MELAQHSVPRINWAFRNNRWHRLPAEKFITNVLAVSPFTVNCVILYSVHGRCRGASVPHAFVRSFLIVIHTCDRSRHITCVSYIHRDPKTEFCFRNWMNDSSILCRWIPALALNTMNRQFPFGLLYDCRVNLFYANWCNKLQSDRKSILFC